MISLYSNFCQKQIEHPAFIRKQVISRILAIASPIIIVPEAAARAYSTVCYTIGYVILAPVDLSWKLIQIFRRKKTLRETQQALNQDFMDVKSTVKKTMYIFLLILVAPTVGVVRPSTMVKFMQSGPLTKKNSTTQIPFKKEPLFSDNLLLKNKIKTHFIDYHIAGNVKQQSSLWNVSPPQILVLHGPNGSGKTSLARHVGQALDRQLIEIDCARKMPLKPLENVPSIIFLNHFSLNEAGREILKLSKKVGIPIVISTTQELPQGEIKSCVHQMVQIPVPPLDNIRRESLLKNIFAECKHKDNFDLQPIATEMEGLKRKEVISLAYESCRDAYRAQTNLTQETVLKCLRRFQKNYVTSESISNDFVGREDIIHTFDLYLEILKNPDEALKYGAKLSSGILFYGKPGCGKSYTAKYLAAYARTKGINMPLISIRASDIASMFKGETVMKIKQAFEEAKKQAPALLVIDECEGLFPSRTQMLSAPGSLNNEKTQELGEFLQLLEDVCSHNVIVIGTTNQLEAIDSAVLRSGRFDYKFEIKSPDKDMRVRLLETKLKHVHKKDAHLDLNEIAEILEGCTTSDIDALVKQSCNQAFIAKVPISASLLKQIAQNIKSQQMPTAPIALPKKGKKRGAIRKLTSVLNPNT